MIKKTLIIALVLALPCIIRAQDPTVKELKDASSKTIIKDPKDTVAATWKKGGLFTINIAQGSLDNWQGGGDRSSFSAISLLNLYAYYKQGKSAWDNTLDLGYGYVSTTSLGTRKSDDRIDLLSKYGYDVGNHWYASALLNARTQFTKGFEYTKTNTGQDVKTLTSNFLAPANVLLSLGFDYKPNDHFSLFLSPVTERWIIVNDDFLSSIGAYGVEPGKKSRNEFGAFLSATFNNEIAKNITYKTRFDAFSNYKSKPGNIDIFWTNIIALRVNKLISANIALDFLYDDNAIARLQRRELLGVGLSAKF